MLVRLETPRMVLRPFELADAEVAHAWFGDPEVMRFISSGPDRSVEQTRARIDGYLEHQRHHGFSKWIIVEKQSGRAVGDVGFMYVKNTVEIELGYRLAQCFWGYGIATEVAETCLEYGFDTLGLREIIAFADPRNRASVRVMEKIGLKYSRSDRIYGMDCVVYSASQTGLGG